MKTSDERELIAEEGERLARPLDDVEADRLVEFFGLLERWGRRIRLTGSHVARELINGHLPDALVMARELGSASSFVDVGAGGGLPALPYLLLAPAGRALMIEANKRKAAFLRTATHHLNISCEVADVRVESVEASACAFELVSSRATFAPEEWLKRASLLTARGAKVIVFVARPERLPAESPGYTLQGCWSYELADGTPRALACYHHEDEA